MIEFKKNWIPAPIDEKNVTTDWLESIFDNSQFVRDTRLMIGLINHCAVQCTWDNNTITWQVSKDLGRGDAHIAFLVLKERLMQAEEGEEQNVFSMIQHGESGKLQLVQTFYFKED